MLILGFFHWRKKKGINFSKWHIRTTWLFTLWNFYKYDIKSYWLWLWTISNKFWSLVSILVDHNSIILMHILIISSLKSVSRYVSYRETSIAIRTVSWGECIIADYLTMLVIKLLFCLKCCLACYQLFNFLIVSIFWYFNLDITRHTIL